MSCGSTADHRLQVRRVSSQDLIGVKIDRNRSRQDASCFQKLITRVGTLVRVEGLEPPRLAAPEPKSGASTNFATPASGLLISNSARNVRVKNALFVRQKVARLQQLNDNRANRARNQPHHRPNRASVRAPKGR